MNKDSVPWSADVDAMFTNIPFEKSKDACVRVWDVLREQRFHDHEVTPEIMGRLITFVLENSYIMFLGVVYKSILCTPMGQRHSVVLANIFMTELYTSFIPTVPEYLPYL